MKHLLLFIVYGLFCSIGATAQFCGVKSENGHNNFNKESENLYNSQARTINVTINPILEVNSLGYKISISYISNILNGVFNEHNIYINVNRGFNFYSNDLVDFYVNQAESDDFDEVGHGPSNSNILLYVVNSINGGSVLGSANNVPGSAIVVDRNYLHSLVTAHEIGHCLGLIHEICRGGFGGRAGCVYLGNECSRSDAIQIMNSSAPPRCVDHFTNEQGEIMRNTFLGDGGGSNALLPDEQVAFRSNLENDILSKRAETSQVLKVYPNPSSDQLTLNIQLIDNENFARVNIIDIMGKVIRSFEHENVRNNQFTYNVNDLAAGAYFLQYVSETGSRTLKFTKQ